MPRLNLRSFVSLKSSFSKGTTPPLCPYSIWKHIAAGTSGTVYEGLWPTHSTLPEVSVAIKKVPKFQRNQSRSPSRTLSSQFRHEVVAMVTAHAAAHLGVIQPYDVYLNDPDHWVLIMEKAKGNLLDLLANRQDLQKFYPSAAPPSYPIPEAVIRSVYDQPITTLTTLNDRGIVHRDIKPENLLYSCSESGCTVKITDFAGATLTSKQNFPPRSLITPEMLPLCLLSLKCITVKHLKTMDVYTLMASIYDAHIYDPSVEKKPTSKAKSTFGLGISMASSYVKREWKDGKVGSRHVSKELIALFNAVLLEENWKKSPQTFGELSHLFDAWKKASLAF
ncbi:kinase-like domain-containing protein [Piptocephalis cylindrospora]|uniref:Kinase-like domain-containing protein n=1 Tax=Piptocephalis cylindrospora TaxID=1907219 RepID=A0A4P9Y1N4_9FUNG|nr:kinase-like domain-containing protein [Piptocephalis cylindrospora]|eukprot:RKP12738.1 kinase-like domain-containing protein [Piptocephalis cylindrospora]